MPVLQRVSVSVKNILLATDFSSASERAARYTKALALNYRSRVEILHIFDPSATTSYVDTVLGTPKGVRRAVSELELGRLQRQMEAAGLETRTRMREGHKLHNEVLKEAAEQETDLIVAGTHSRWGLEKLVLGSTAEQLIRNAHCPVLTVGPMAREPHDGPLVFRSIVYATDFSAEAAKAAAFALSFAQDSGAHLYFCHVAEADPLPEHRATVDAPFRAALEKMIPESAYDWCSPEVVVRHGEAAETILRLAERVHADLIVLGARNASFWLTHFDAGLTPSLLAEAACPVMTVC